MLSSGYILPKVGTSIGGDKVFISKKSAMIIMNSERDIQEAFKILGIPVGSTDDEIKQRMRILQRRFHPDKNPNPGAEEEFKNIQFAYSIISEPRYNKTRRKSASRQQQSASSDSMTKTIVEQEFVIELVSTRPFRMLGPMVTFRFVDPVFGLDTGLILYCTIHRNYWRVKTLDGTVIGRLRRDPASNWNSIRTWCICGHIEFPGGASYFVYIKERWGVFVKELNIQDSLKNNVSPLRSIWMNM